MVSRPNSRQNNSKPKGTKSDGFIRIIGGLWKGRKLKVINSEGLRPTTDRIKETVFNWLMFDIQQKNVLDCYAGSGSLGFEALSRGASSVVLIEREKLIAKQIEHNITALNLSSDQSIKVITSDCLTFLTQVSATTDKLFDLVFIDPPFNQNLIEQTVDYLERHNVLAPNALIYIESEKQWVVQGIPTHWQPIKEKTTGQVCYRLFKRQGEK